uniref:hydrolase 1, exosortase A system-associated n=1 Tax=uncultured Sphingomonas sp. TaxID=158754 RepID=UPI0035CA6B41
MRRVMTFACGGETVFATLDEAPGTTGLLIVSGGNEIRIGAHRGMAMLAQRLAQRGIPVFRFDRRGIGDSTGENLGFLSSAPDIACAAAVFRAETGIARLVGFGNCDAATALALFGTAAGIDRLILANPWLIEETDDLPPAAAIRARYVEKLRDPREWLRLARGGVDLRKLASGLAKLSKSRLTVETSLAVDLLEALAGWKSRATILLARRDNTALAFAEAANTIDLEIPLHHCDTASHSFAQAGDAAWLEEQIVAALRRT